MNELPPAEIHQLENQAGEHARDRMHVILGCIAIAAATIVAAYWIGG